MFYQDNNKRWCRPCSGISCSWYSSCIVSMIRDEGKMDMETTRCGERYRMWRDVENTVLVQVQRHENTIVSQRIFIKSMDLFASLQRFNEK